MLADLFTERWFRRWQEELNASEAYHHAARHWEWPVVLVVRLVNYGLGRGQVNRLVGQLQQVVVLVVPLVQMALAQQVTQIKQAFHPRKPVKLVVLQHQMNHQRFILIKN